MTLKRKRAVMARLQAIAGEAGTLTPEAVLADAADPESVLHDCFEWDDTKAAHQYRLDQARSLIRIRMTVTVDEREIVAPSWVRNPDSLPSEQGYVSVARMRDDKDRARDVLLAEIDRAMAAFERARNIGAVLGLADEVEAMMGRLRSLRTVAANANAKAA